ncbi:MAG: MarR family transcriptional regulator [Anaerolineaceae bacterium]|nr:MarR family transcriptional regulator [Anaerolineaceae bacterium]
MDDTRQVERNSGAEGGAQKGAPQNCAAQHCAALEDTAARILEVVPQIMQAIRVEIRRSRASDLSVVQQRVLGFLRRRPGCSLSELAEHIGLTLSSASTLVDGLVDQGLLLRVESAEDRRRVELRLSEAGSQQLEAALKSAREGLVRQLAGLTEEQCRLIQQALDILEPNSFS